MDVFADWIAGTALSRTIAQVTWIIPWLQIIHITTLALVFGAVFMLSVRILGLTGMKQTVALTAHRFLPWIWGGTVVLAVTGLLLVIGEPVRSLLNAFFWAKMGLLVLALALTGVFQTTLASNPGFWENGREWGGIVRLVAVVALATWIAIIVLGRFIAYVETFIY